MSNLKGCLSFKQVWMYSEVIDFRKQANGLIQIIIEELEKNPNDGSLYVFRNRQRNRMKIIVWNKNGYFLGLKRLEKGRFDFPLNESGIIELTEEEFQGLLWGMPMVEIKSLKKPIYHY